MDTYIDEIVSSFDIKSLKDTAEAYQICLDKLDEDASEAIFVGHQQYEMIGAKKARVTSICLRPIAIPSDVKGDYIVDSLAAIKSILPSIQQA
jgi:FMN phosphatase YigB (HAD superfamily)